jgi:hypothetical protein
MAYSRLRAAIPAIPVSRNAEDYCIALLAVREAFPQARTVFSGLRDAREVREAEAALADRFDRELSRQVRSRPSKGRIFTLASSLIGGVGGGALGLVMGADPTVGAASGLAFGMVSGIASNEIQNAVSRRAGLRRRPWLLAVDRLEQMMAERAADNPPRLR